MYGYDIFHEDIMQELISNVRSNSSEHAYLFTGPAGIGKRVCARLFANALACVDQNSAPCGKCPACIGAKSNTNPDIIYLVPEEDKKTISVQQARKIVSDAYIKPFESSKKIYIAEDSSLLNEAAQNCLLKILEEPPEYIVFILISVSEEVLLQTILSRCTKIHFPSVSDENIEKYIKTKYPEESGRTKLLTQLAGGVPLVLDNILSDPDYDTLRQASFEKLAPLLSSRKLSAYTICDFLEENKEKADMIMDFWQSFLRDMMILKNASEEYIINVDMQERMKKIAYKMPDNFPIIALEQITIAKMMLKKYVNLHSLGLNLSFSIKNRLYEN